MEFEEDLLLNMCIIVFTKIQKYKNIIKLLDQACFTYVISLYWVLSNFRGVRFPVTQLTFVLSHNTSISYLRCLMGSAGGDNPPDAPRRV